jgi:apolipoprotein N-acyltransferase
VSAGILTTALIVLHAACGILLVLVLFRGRSSRSAAFLLVRVPEILLALSSVLFLFSYIYATNANMDYVQRFMATHGNLRLAPNSAQERAEACLRYLPLISLDALWYLLVRIRRPLAARSVFDGSRPAATWALPLAMLSGLLTALAFPSFLRVAGLPVLGWLCMVPLMLCLSAAPPGWGIFYGTLAGVLQTMITNYWLGTFNLLTLQFVTVVTALEYIPFMAAALFILRRSSRAGFLVLPVAWTVFDWLRSMGFLGYPWGMLGTSQYSVLPVIQIAAVVGVWGVTFLVTLTNSVIAWYLTGAAARARRGPAALIVLAVAVGLTLGWGVFWAAGDAMASRGAPARTVRLALVQQNDDPRKDDYRSTFDILRRLTDASLASKPDLIVWSETAFVPNIRRWSREDPAAFPLAALVRDFLAYQKSMHNWLLTGNDDYSLLTRDGVEERLDYNGAVLFSPAGGRVETYHKIHLVPFTEFFPYKKQLPAVYALLQSFDAYLWEPGDRRVVFHHPKLSFSTPICFEDVFPDDVRKFVAEGAEAILNISNDYWSLTETEAMQHAANSIFRAVENDRPLARASASGLTCVVDPRGRIVARSPLFKEALLIANVRLAGSRQTPYTRWGDWFPMLLLAALVLMLIGGLARRRDR